MVKALFIVSRMPLARKRPEAHWSKACLAKFSLYTKNSIIPFPPDPGMLPFRFR